MSEHKEKDPAYENYLALGGLAQGRMVRYRHPGSADGVHPPRNSPAVVQEVLNEETGLCRLFIMGPKGQHMDEVEYGNGPGKWTWPPKV